MTADERFQNARDNYEAQIFDAIEATRVKMPWAAMTLAGCAIDFLSHVIRGRGRDAFEKTVRKQVLGYAKPGVPEKVYELRSGLVHEFRTLAPDHILITGGTAEPKFKDGHLIIAVDHFFAAVRAAFDHFYATADPAQKAAFADRATIYVKPLGPAPAQLTVLGAPSATSVDAVGQSAAVPAASGSGSPGPGQVDMYDPKFRDSFGNCYLDPGAGSS